MQIIDYKFFHGTEQRDGYVAIPELNRVRPAANQFIQLADLDIELTRPTAFLYVDGFSVSPSEASLHPVQIKNYMPCIKTGAAYVMYRWLETFKNLHYITKVEVMSSACAAGIQAFYEADKILKNKEAEEVIIIGGERITSDTMRIFKELRIPVICGDGFGYMRLDADGEQIQHCKWGWAYNSNPFQFERSTLNSLIPHYPIDHVKLHGTGTSSNTEAEKDLEELANPIMYKPKIGHAQGVSGLLETCMVYDDPEITGNILITANGLGGHYGAFTLVK